jgi:hypothetical protein
MCAAMAKDLALCLAFTLLLWAPAGRRFLLRMGMLKPASSQALCVSLGMALWGFVILVMGISRLLYGPLVAAVAFILFFRLRLDRRLLPPDREGIASGMTLGQRLAAIPLAALSAFFILMVAASSLAPELAFDALNVHLPYARDSAAAGRLLFVPNNWSSIMPALPLMSYVTAFLYSGANLAKLFNAVCFLACGGVAYFFARRWWGRLHGIAAATLFWSCPVALYEGTTAMVDLFLTLYSALALLCLLEWVESDDRTFLWLSALSLGLALGCKYQAAFWVLPFSLVLSIRVLKKRRGPRRAAALLVRYFALVSAVFLPWVVRAWYLSDNPVFPLANRIFHSAYFTPAMEDAALAAYQNEGVGRSVQALLMLPWTATFHPGPFRGTLGFVFLLGAALALVRDRSMQTRYGLLSIAIYFYSWALTAQEVRYLLPVAPFLAVVSARGLLWGSRTRRPGTGRLVASHAGAALGYLSLVAGCCLALPFVYPRVVTDWTYWHSYQSPLRYLSGRETAEEFLQRDVPSIYVYGYVNRHLSNKDRILLLNDAAQFYSEVPTLYSFTIEGEGILFETTEEGVMRRLRQSGITHVLLNLNGLAPLPRVKPRQGVYFFLDADFQERHLAPVFSSHNVILYRVLPS